MFGLPFLADEDAFPASCVLSLPLFVVMLEAPENNDFSVGSLDRRAADIDTQGDPLPCHGQAQQNVVLGQDLSRCVGIRTGRRVLELTTLLAFRIERAGTA
jgi:hypothetical protein